MHGSLPVATLNKRIHKLHHRQHIEHYFLHAQNENICVQMHIIDLI
jgi:hypothetical protein